MRAPGTAREDNATAIAGSIWSSVVMVDFLQGIAGTYLSLVPYPYPLGNPRPRMAMMFRCTSLVPAATV